MIKIQIPATSANLGAGFDALGLALNFYNYVNIEEADGISVKSLDNIPIPVNKDNLVFSTAKTLFEICGKPFYGLNIEQENNIPIARGLGSSSACIIAGLVGANKLMNEPLGLDDLVNISAQIEGHPDNTAPALLGGIVTAVFDGKAVFWVKQEVFTTLKFIAVIPDFEMKTDKARECLPNQIAHADAIYNLSRAALFSASLLTGKYENLKTAVNDRLHQPYRMEMIPNSNEIFDISYSLGAYGVYLSGAGPTLMIIADADNAFFSGKLRFALDRLGLKTWIIHEMQIDNKGTILI